MSTPHKNVRKTTPAAKYKKKKAEAKAVGQQAQRDLEEKRHRNKIYQQGRRAGIAAEEKAEVERAALEESREVSRLYQRNRRAKIAAEENAKAKRVYETKRKQNQRKNNREKWRTALLDANMVPPEAYDKLKIAYENLQKKKAVLATRAPAPSAEGLEEVRASDRKHHQGQGHRTETKFKAAAKAPPPPPPPEQRSNNERQPLYNLSNQNDGGETFVSEDDTAFEGMGAKNQLKPSFQRLLQQQMTERATVDSSSVHGDTLYGGNRQHADRSGHDIDYSGVGHGDEMTDRTTIEHATIERAPTIESEDRKKWCIALFKARIDPLQFTDNLEYAYKLYFHEGIDPRQFEADELKQIFDSLSAAKAPPAAKKSSPSYGQANYNERSPLGNLSNSQHQQYLAGGIDSTQIESLAAAKAPAAAKRAPSSFKQYERSPLGNVFNKHRNNFVGDDSSQVSLAAGRRNEMKRRAATIGRPTIDPPMSSPSFRHGAPLMSSNIPSWTSSSGRQRASRSVYGNSLGPTTTPGKSVSYAQPTLTPGKSVAYAPTLTSDTSVAYAPPKTPKTPMPVQTPRPPVQTPAAADRVQTPVAADLDFEHAPNSALRNCLTRRELNYEEYGVIEMQKQMAAQVINTTSQGLQYIKEENERLGQFSARQLELIQEERDFLNGNHYEFVLPHDTPGGRMPPQDRQDVADSTPGNEAEVSSNAVNYSGNSITDEEEGVKSPVELPYGHEEEVYNVENSLQRKQNKEVQDIFDELNGDYIRKAMKNKLTNKTNKIVLYRILDEMNQVYDPKAYKPVLAEQILKAHQEVTKKDKAIIEDMVTKHPY